MRSVRIRPGGGSTPQLRWPQSWRRRCWLSATSPGTASQRSGSGWFETLPNSHVNVGSNREIFSNKERRINFSSVIKTMDKASLWSWC